MRIVVYLFHKLVRRLLSCFILIELETYVAPATISSIVFDFVNKESTKR